ncbi:Tol-Pal system protein TolB [subsurface metagenome]
MALYFYCRRIDEEPAWSPDGRYIAYFHDPNDIPIVCLIPILFIGCSHYNELEDRRAGVWIIDLETMDSEFLIEGWSPDWSPDSKEIVYVNNRNIYKINVATKEIKQLTTEGFFPDWSPDNRSIAFSINAGDSAGLYIMDSSGNNIHNIGEWGWIDPDWHPGGSKLTFIGWFNSKGGVCIADTNGDNARLILEGGDSPVFSPDGSNIAYVSERDRKRNIYLIDTLGQNEVKLTDVDWAIEPSWSPDGSKIVFSQWNDEAMARCLWIMNSDGSGKRQITWPDN